MLLTTFALGMLVPGYAFAADATQQEAPPTTPAAAEIAVTPSVSAAANEAGNASDQQKATVEKAVAGETAADKVVKGDTPISSKKTATAADETTSDVAAANKAAKEDAKSTSKSTTLSAQSTSEDQSQRTMLTAQSSSGVGTLYNPQPISICQEVTGTVYTSDDNGELIDHYQISLPSEGTYILLAQNTDRERSAFYIYAYDDSKSKELFNTYSFNQEGVKSREIYVGPGDMLPKVIRIKLEAPTGYNHQYIHYKFKVVKVGWNRVGSKLYYCDADGNQNRGWQTINGNRYYFKSDKSAAKGLTTISGKRYYFNPSTGAAKKGWQTVAGKRYYFSASTKAAVKGLRKISGKRYYFNPSNWAAYKGWKTISGKRYYFKSSYQAASGWNTISKKRYYFSTSTNAALKGWKELGGKWYYFNSSKGAAAKGWATIGGARYHFDSKWRMQTGWHKISGKRYYFNSSGAMQKAKWIGNYYVKSNGVMATNTWIGRYHVNAKGLWDRTR